MITASKFPKEPPMLDLMIPRPRVNNRTLGSTTVMDRLRQGFSLPLPIPPKLMKPSGTVEVIDIDYDEIGEQIKRKQSSSGGKKPTRDGDESPEVIMINSDDDEDIQLIESTEQSRGQSVNDSAYSSSQFPSIEVVFPSHVLELPAAVLSDSVSEASSSTKSEQEMIADIPNVTSVTSAPEPMYPGDDFFDRPYDYYDLGGNMMDELPFEGTTSPFLSSTATVDEDEQLFAQLVPASNLVLTDEQIVDEIDQLLSESNENYDLEHFKALTFEEILADLMRSTELPVLNISEPFAMEQVDAFSVPPVFAPIASISASDAAAEPVIEVANVEENKVLQFNVNEFQKRRASEDSDSIENLPPILNKRQKIASDEVKVPFQTRSSSDSDNVDMLDTDDSQDGGNRTKKRRRFLTLSLTCFMKDCPVSMPNVQRLDQHLKEAHGIQKFRCLLCKTSYKKRDELSEHTTAEHDNLTKWQCDICPFETASQARLGAHFKENHMQGVFKCALEGCQYPVQKTYAEIRKHHRSLTHTAPRMTKFSCTVADCLGPKIFESKEKRDEHVKQVHADPVLEQLKPKLVVAKKTVAKSDMKAAPKKTAPKKTAQVKLPGVKKFYCRYCDKGYDDKRNFQSHVNSHEGVKIYSCGLTDCNFTSVYATSVEKHIRTIHKSVDLELFVVKVPLDVSAKKTQNVMIEQGDAINSPVIQPSE